MISNPFQVSMDLAEKIKPALNFDQQGKTLSTEEFQHLLYEYFEERGIISDMRSHLRAQMVNVLKETGIGKAIISKKTEISPKLQAQNLLIAEYLLQRNYHYSLSVLSSEVPLANAFPPTSFIDQQKNNATFRFATSDMCDILEAIGFNRQPELAAKLCSKYKSSSKESLLTCILQSIPVLMEEKNATNQENLKVWLSKHDMQSLNIECIINLLKATGVNIDIILKICELVKEAIVTEVKTLKKLKDEQLSKIKQQMSQEAACKIKKYKEKIVKLEGFFKQEKQRLEDELQNTKKSLKQATSKVQAKYNDVNEFNDHIKCLETRLKQQELTLLTKEHTMQQRQEYLENKQKIIDKQFEDMLLISRSQQVLPAQQESKETGMREIERKETKETETKTVTRISASMETIGDSREVELHEENVRLKKNSDEMQEQITKLKDQNISYQSKIQELLLRTNSLLTQLETTRNNDLRRSNISKQHQVPYHGGGEEGLTEFLPSPCEFSTSHETRRLKSPCAIIQCSSSEEITPTDEVLKEAKSRLLELERESEAIDQHFETLPKSTIRTIDSNAAGLIQSFQCNVSLLRDSLTKIFKSDSRCNTAPQQVHSDPNISNRCCTKTGQTNTEVAQEQDEPATGAEIGLFEKRKMGLKSKNKQREELRNEDEDEGDLDIYNSTTSSNMVINTSMSTLDVSGGRNSSSMCEWLDID